MLNTIVIEEVEKNTYTECYDLGHAFVKLLKLRKGYEYYFLCNSLTTMLENNTYDRPQCMYGICITVKEFGILDNLMLI